MVMGEFHYTVPMEHMDKPGEWVLNLYYRGMAPERIQCPACRGTGTLTGWAVQYDDDDRNCKSCSHGTIPNPEYIQPKPPQWLVDQLSKVMRDAWNKQRNEDFKLT